ncbi:M1 family metallopeptidase [Zunongwangia sp. HGR-M22]|uniref:M1 family metallopeptidase n=1 Tax=Zunongwangia sp. HGR-M22 TaxID=3015168 RepID=UPI0022DD2DEF|nr:M1 family aminopeptidase [Zunongwangia sp. HGR-M22]WBL27069.1 M1 family aminopeptidase [Zunongwangia sp. HGR-M22]
MKRNFFLLSILNILTPALLFAQNPKVDILEYEFHLDLNDNNDVIKGKALIDFKYTEDSGVLALDFASEENGKGMSVDSILQNGKNLDFKHSEEKLSISTTSEEEIRIYYHGVPKDGLIISENKYGDRTFFGDNWPNRAHLWLPVIDHPSDKAKVSFYVSAPSKYQVVATGTLHEMTNLNEEKTLYVYSSPLNLPTKVMVIGVAEFAVQHLGEIDEIPLSSWVYPENKEAGFYDYEQAEEILSFFTENIAPFPFTKLANVQSTTRYGGMENAGNIFYFENSVDGKRSSEFLLAHEIAHQWFGDSASEIDWSHLWLSEGFATYFTDLYAEHKYGKSKLDEKLQEERRQVIGFSQTTKTAVIDSSRTDLMELLNPNSYQKGAWVLHMLRRKVGDDNFWNAIREYYQKFKFSNATSADLKAEFEAASGDDLDLFFEQWTTQYGQPKLKIDQSFKNGKLKITVRQLQKNQFKFPLELQLNFATKEPKTIEFDITKKKETFEIEVSEKPVSIDLDPNTNLLFEEAL